MTSMWSSRSPKSQALSVLSRVLVGGVELGAAAVGEALGSRRRRPGRGPAAVLPAVDQPGELPRRPALLVEVGGEDQLLHAARSWSSVSRMVKLALRPTSSAWRRSIRAAIEWKVPSHGMPSTAPPTDRPTPLLHFARRLVGEGDGEDLLGQARRVAIRWASRAVSAAVLPVPAPASTSTGPSVVSTASRCGGLRPADRRVRDGGGGFRHWLR